MKNQDYRLKYADLKLKFHDAVDVAFRLGFEQGAQNAQVQQAQQAEAAAQQAAMQPGQDPNAPPGQDPNSPEQPDGSELDQHIQQLESMVNKPGSGAPEQAALQKSLNGIKAFQFGLKQASELRKSEKAIAAIAKSMKTPFTMSKTANKNLTEPGKRALNDQEKIVENLMKSFEEEETRAKEAITKTLNIEQLLKG
jgi:hypothetical protein